MRWIFFRLSIRNINVNIPLLKTIYTTDIKYQICLKGGHEMLVKNLKTLTNFKIAGRENHSCRFPRKPEATHIYGPTICFKCHCEFDNTLPVNICWKPQSMATFSEKLRWSRLHYSGVKLKGSGVRQPKQDLLAPQVQVRACLLSRTSRVRVSFNLSMNQLPHLVAYPRRSSHSYCPEVYIPVVRVW